MASGKKPSGRLVAPKRDFGKKRKAAVSASVASSLAARMSGSKSAKTSLWSRLFGRKKKAKATPPARTTKAAPKGNIFVRLTKESQVFGKDCVSILLSIWLLTLRFQPIIASACGKSGTFHAQKRAFIYNALQIR